MEVGKPWVLGCTRRETMDLAQLGTCEHFDCRYSLTSEDAYRQLDERPGVLLCNTQFDEGRIVEFLHAVRQHPHGAQLPVILVHSFDRMTPVMRESIQAAAQVVGALEVIDASEWLASSSLEFKLQLVKHVKAALHAGRPAR